MSDDQIRSHLPEQYGANGQRFPGGSSAANLEMVGA